MICRRTAREWGSLLLLGVAVGCSGTGNGGTADGPDGPVGDAVQSPDGSDADQADGGPSFDGLDTDGWLPPEHCGNGVLDPGEECDDGNRMNGDECDWACRGGPGMPDPRPEEPATALTADRSPAPVENATTGIVRPTATFFDGDCRLPFLWTGDSYAAVWVDTPDSSPPIARFLRIDRAGRRTGPEWQLVYEAREFAQLAMAWSGDGFALVWCPGLSSGPVSAVLLDREGKPTGPPISLAEDGSGCYPAVAFDGTA